MSMEKFWKRVRADLAAIVYFALSSVFVYGFFNSKETFSFALFFQCIGQLLIYLKLQYIQSDLENIRRVPYWIVFIIAFSIFSILGFSFNSFLVEEFDAMSLSSGFNVSNFPVFTIIMASRLPWYYFFYSRGRQRVTDGKSGSDAKSKD